MALILHYLLFTLYSSVLSQTPRPRPLVWSTQIFGPDGPWQAVEISVGTPPQQISLYPGGVFESLVLAPSVCNGNSLACRNGGFFNASGSSTSLPVPEAGSITNTSFVPTGGLQNLTGSASFVLDNMIVPPSDGFTPATVPSFSMLVVTNGSETLADGSTYPVLVGNLALGAAVQNQTWTNGTSGQQINGTIISNYLFATGQIPSNSYGLHIGSARYGMPGSLYLGGYDQFRIVGPVSGQAYQSGSLPISLLDIGIGVQYGGSPFSYTSKTGLLAQGNDTLQGSVAVEIDPKEPYLYLPESTCSAIAAELPVTYQPKFGLYFWNTADPLYQQIITSPSYLSFTFQMNNTISQNFTIKVPFALLSLNLTTPLVPTTTAYFPCSLPRLPAYRLGRAFLQAAFISINWMTDYQGLWFLAQAPGPNIPLAPNVLSIGSTDRYLLQSQNDWETSWSKTWIALLGGNNTNSNSTSPGGNGSSSLGGGAIAGIVVGAIAGVALVVGVLFCLWRRKRGSSDSRVEPTPAAKFDQPKIKIQRAEMAAGVERPRHEMPDSSRDPDESVRAELVG